MDDSDLRKKCRLMTMSDFNTLDFGIEPDFTLIKM